MLLPEKPWCPISLLEYPITFLGAQSGIRRRCFHLLVTRSQHPRSLGECPTRCQHGHFDPTEGLASPSAPESISWLHKGTWRRLRNQLGTLPVKLVRTLGSNNRPAFRRQKGSLIISQRNPSGPMKVKPCLSGSGSRVEMCGPICICV
jgi:hypothetical protein